MRDVMEKVDGWLAEGQDVMLATVVKVWGSAPRPPGSHLAQGSSGGIAGSVSGGCVEGAVLEEGQALLEDGGNKLLSFGVEDELAWNVGLSCGGQIEVFCEKLDPAFYAEMRRELAADRLAAVATVIAGPHRGRRRLLRPDGEALGSLGAPALDAFAERLLGEQLASFEARRDTLEDGGESHEIFLEVLPPRPELVVVGAVHVAIPLVAIANLLGFRTVVVDPRTAFATRERFRHADELLHEWPDEALRHVGIHRNSFVALLSHDPKLDVPAARVALEGKARYVGALGSKKTHEKRVAKALREAGVPEDADRPPAQPDRARPRRPQGAGDRGGGDRRNRRGLARHRRQAGRTEWRHGPHRIAVVLLAAGEARRFGGRQAAPPAGRRAAGAH